MREHYLSINRNLLNLISSLQRPVTQRPARKRFLHSSQSTKKRLRSASTRITARYEFDRTGLSLSDISVAGRRLDASVRVPKLVRGCS